MYGQGSGSVTEVVSAAVTTGGAVVLPHTGGSMLATVLAYVAISVGGAALLSQIGLRVARRFYR